MKILSLLKIPMIMSALILSSLWSVADATDAVGVQGLATASSAGTRGPRGPIGPRGPKGAKGEPGVQGPIGMTGATGAKGDTGAMGATGAMGPAGSSGSGSSFAYSMTCGASGKVACKVGEVGPGGGWIFFVDYNDEYPGFNYLEAAPTDIAVTQWCNITNTSIPQVAAWSARALGAGKANTTAMLGACSTGAAKQADLYLTANKSDWYLPSINELTLMYKNLADHGVGGITKSDSTSFWSSSESDDLGAWTYDFYYGDAGYAPKNAYAPVRAVRAF